MSQHQRIVITERSAIPSTGIPPIGSGVDHGVSTSATLVCLPKFLDPRDHCSGAQTITGRARRVIFKVHHSGKGLAISRPASSMGQKIVGLSRAGAAVRMGEVVATTDQAGVGCTCVVA